MKQYQQLFLRSDHKVGEHRSPEGLLVNFCVIVGLCLFIEYICCVSYERRALLLIKGLCAWAVNKNQSKPAIIRSETFLLPLWPTFLIVMHCVTHTSRSSGRAQRPRRQQLTQLLAFPARAVCECGGSPEWSPGPSMSTDQEPTFTVKLIQLMLLSTYWGMQIWVTFISSLYHMFTAVHHTAVFRWRDHCNLMKMIMFHGFIFSFLRRLRDGQSFE